MNTPDSGGFDLDRLLDQELQRSVGGLTGPSSTPAQSAYHVFAIGGKSMSFLSSVTAAASTKAAAGLAAAALVAGGGSVAATAATGSANPSVWGKTVTAAVETCKADLKPGEHGIGQCVSAVASRKGAEERSAHSASAARQDHPNGKTTDAGNGHPGEHPSTVPAGSGGNHPPAHR